jgi:hypothetical protein
MANIDKPFGLRPLGNLSATGAQKQYGYTIADNQAGAIYQGDLVTLSSGYVVKYDSGLHTVAVGVFNGCYYVDPTTGKPTWKNFYPGSVNLPAGQVIQADLMDDPSQLFLIQADEDVIQADIGLNADIAYTAGSNTTGVSASELDSSTIANVAGKVLKIVGFFNAPENTPGENFVDVVVKINAHMYGSAGVANTAPAP